MFVDQLRGSIIFSGASITNSSAWPTWVDFVRERYRAYFVDVSKKGQGNEAIIMRSLHAAWQQTQHDNDVRIMIMLSTIDKWDCYVDHPELVKRYDQEKHNITRLTPDAPGGFWCTGSWFPLEKELYQKNFYSQDYFVFRSLQLIHMFVGICQQQGWQYNIFYDSPIWNTTEQQLNHGIAENVKDNSLISTQLNHWLYDLLHQTAKQSTPGLIGYLVENNLPWFSKKYGPHPGPWAHYCFSRAHIFPVLDTHYEIVKQQDWLEQYAKRMDRLWTA